MEALIGFDDSPACHRGDVDAVDSAVGSARRGDNERAIGCQGRGKRLQFEDGGGRAPSLPAVVPNDYLGIVESHHRIAAGAQMQFLHHVLRLVIFVDLFV